MIQPMEQQSRFKIVFDKLTEAVDQSQGLPSEAPTDNAELDEIAELRKIALSISDPEPVSYTLA
jgi:hypothetical protein